MEPEPDPTLDTDSDGMPDLYEIDYGFDIFVKDGLEDPDYDGYTNIQEYENGTNPMDINSHPYEDIISTEESMDEEIIPSLWTSMICCFVFIIISVCILAVVLLILIMRRKDPEG